MWVTHLAGGSAETSGRVRAAVLLDHVDVPVRAVEEEPAKARHARVIEKLVRPDELADQLNVCGYQFFTRGEDVVHREGDDGPFGHLGREDARVIVLGAEDFDEVAVSRGKLEYRPANLAVHVTEPEHVSKQRRRRVKVPCSRPEEADPLNVHAPILARPAQASLPTTCASVRRLTLRRRGH